MSTTTETTPRERPDENDVIVQLVVKATSLPALEEGLVLGTGIETGAPHVVRLRQLAAGRYWMEIEAGHARIASQAPETRNLGPVQR